MNAVRNTINTIKIKNTMRTMRNIKIKKSKTTLLLSLLLMSFFVLILLVAQANALVASIGNAVMVIHTTVSPGKVTTVERTILVKNVNEITVNATLTSKDDMLKIATIRDKFLLLNPGESREARITLKVSEPGVYRGDIVVLFAGVEDNRTSYVALSSSIIVDAAPENSTIKSNQNINQSINTQNNNQGSSQNTTSNQNSISQVNQIKLPSNIVVGAMIIVAAAIIGLIIFLLILRKQ